MANPVWYSIGVVVLMVASILVVAAEDDPCAIVLIPTPPSLKSCLECVNKVVSKDRNCTLLFTQGPPECVLNTTIAEGANIITNATTCESRAWTNTTTTTPAPITTSTPPPPTTNGTTPATTVPTIPTTIPTTPTTPATTPIPSSTTTNGTSTTKPPTKATTAVPTPAPSGGGGMSFASFFAGIVFTLCMSGLGYLIWRFYKARMDRNYHTFSNPSF